MPLFLKWLRKFNGKYESKYGQISSTDENILFVQRISLMNGWQLHFTGTYTLPRVLSCFNFV
jgi:hypothetical protein